MANDCNPEIYLANIISKLAQPAEELDEPNLADLQVRVLKLGSIATYLVDQLAPKIAPNIAIDEIQTKRENHWFWPEPQDIEIGRSRLAQGWVIRSRPEHFQREGWETSDGNHGSIQPAHWIPTEGLCLATDTKVIEYVGDETAATASRASVADFKRGELPLKTIFYPVHESEKQRLISAAGRLPESPAVVAANRLVYLDKRVGYLENMMGAFAKINELV